MARLSNKIKSESKCISYRSCMMSCRISFISSYLHVL
nr:MAG TPA: hypothetical protein [Caudoviricetes sp.]